MALQPVLGLALGLAVVATLVGEERPPDDGKKVVLFVCEHGAAKSVLAAAHFNARAAQRRLPWRALARGVDPQAQPSGATVKGLAEEGLTARPERPLAVTESDVAAASRVVTFGCDISRVAPKARPESWADVPAPSDGYAASRDALDRHIDALLDELTPRSR